MEWRQLPGSMPLPLSSAAALPCAQLFPQTHTHTDKAAKGLIYLSAVVGGRPLLSWWWLWQHRSMWGRLSEITGCQGWLSSNPVLIPSFHTVDKQKNKTKTAAIVSFSFDHEIRSGCFEIVHPNYKSQGRRSSQNWSQNLVTAENPLITGLLCCTTALLMAGVFN